MTVVERGSEPIETVVGRVEAMLSRWVYPERKRLTQMLARGAEGADEIRAALERLCEAASQTLGVERASVWRVGDGGRRIDCVNLFERSRATHSSGSQLLADGVPSYFKALGTESAIAAHDARTDPRTSEFDAGYLTPLGISSMLDAPVFASGRMVGVICHEHVGPARRWQAWEELVAGTFADFVALVFEADRRLQTRGPGPERPEVAKLRELIDEEQSVQSLLDASPVPLVLTRASDHRMMYGNRRARAMFDVSSEGLTHLDATTFWASGDEHRAFLERLYREGRVDDLEVRLKSATGRAFWARLSAEAVRFRGEMALLGSMVEITAQRRAEENLRNVFARAPIALVISRLSDQVLLEGNRHAAKLFEVDVDRARGLSAPDFWVHPEDRERLRQEVVEKGSAEGFVAELRTANGRHFWSELSAAVVNFDETPALLVGGQDITLRKRAEEALRESEDSLRTLLDAAPLPLVVTGFDDGVVRYCNYRAAMMFELPLDQFVGKRAPDFYAIPTERQSFLDQLKKRGRVDGQSAQLRTSGGRTFWALLNARTLILHGEEVFMVSFAEVTAQKELEQRLWHMATTDGLTQIFNRRHFFELAEAELARAARYGHATSVAMVDVDHFKAINDRLGHQQGDAALKLVAATVRGQVRDVDVVARYGGEEFVVLLPETPLAAAEITMARVREAVAKSIESADPQWKDVRLTVSVGVAQRHDGETLDGLLRRADEALYGAKVQGRDRVVAA